METKSVLHTEMAKKNLFVKRGEILIGLDVISCSVCVGHIMKLLV